MKSKKKKFIFLLLFIILIVGEASRINTYTPIGAIRYTCLSQGHFISALFLEAKQIEKDMDKGTTVYKITSFIPYEKATATHLDIWGVIKNKNNTYSAAYSAG